MTEFALIAPLLLLIATGIFDFGRAVSANITVANAAREGARAIATTATLEGSSPFGQACPTSGGSITAPTSGSPQAKAWGELQNASLTMSQVTLTVRFYTADPASNPATVTYTCPAGGTEDGTPNISPSGSTYSPSTGNWVQFEISYHFSPSTPLISSLMSSGITVDQTSTMVLE